MKAATQPTKVQPSKKFSQKIALEFRFFRPTIAGRKYRSPQIMKTSIQWKGENSPIAF